MKFISLLSLILILILLLSGCHKNDTPIYDLSDEQKSFLNFQKGSYWIMRDSVTGRTDSFVVSEVSNYETQESNGTDGDFVLMHKNIFIEGYNNSGLKNGYSWDLLFTGKGSQMVSQNGPVPLYFFNMTFDTQNVLINGASYSFISITQGGIGFFDRQHIFLKMRDTSNHLIWEIERNNIIK